MSAYNLPEIERSYGQDAAAEWRLVLRHFELSDGFAFIVVTVPDRMAARLCHDDLVSFLAASELRVERIETNEPGALGQLSRRLMSLPKDPETGAVWVEQVSSEFAQDHLAWNDSWHQALGSLNQQRNQL